MGTMSLEWGISHHWSARRSGLTADVTLGWARLADRYILKIKSDIQDSNQGTGPPPVQRCNERLQERVEKTSTGEEKKYASRFLHATGTDNQPTKRCSQLLYQQKCIKLKLQSNQIAILPGAGGTIMKWWHIMSLSVITRIFTISSCGGIRARRCGTKARRGVFRANRGYYILPKKNQTVVWWTARLMYPLKGFKEVVRAVRGSVGRE